MRESIRKGDQLYLMFVRKRKGYNHGVDILSTTGDTADVVDVDATTVALYAAAVVADVDGSKPLPLQTNEQLLLQHHDQTNHDQVDTDVDDSKRMTTVVLVYEYTVERDRVSNYKGYLIGFMNTSCTRMNQNVNYFVAMSNLLDSLSVLME